jgi:hypothetical protein
VNRPLKRVFCEQVRLLFTVTGTFVVPGRGIVLLPELKPVGEEKFKVGDPLRLRHPNGVESSVPIGELEFLQPINGGCQLVVVLTGMEQQDVPVRTEIWSVNETPGGPLLR